MACFLYSIPCLIHVIWCYMQIDKHRERERERVCLSINLSIYQSIYLPIYVVQPSTTRPPLMVVVRVYVQYVGCMQDVSYPTAPGQNQGVMGSPSSFYFCSSFFHSCFLELLFRFSSLSSLFVSGFFLLFVCWWELWIHRHSRKFHAALN